jgi:hypothetical protein
MDLNMELNTNMKLVIENKSIEIEKALLMDTCNWAHGMQGVTNDDSTLEIPARYKVELGCLVFFLKTVNPRRAASAYSKAIALKKKHIELSTVMRKEYTASECDVLKRILSCDGSFYTHVNFADFMQCDSYLHLLCSFIALNLVYTPDIDLSTNAIKMLEYMP